GRRGHEEELLPLDERPKAIGEERKNLAHGRDVTGWQRLRSHTATTPEWFVDYSGVVHKMELTGRGACPDVGRSSPSRGNVRGHSTHRQTHRRHRVLRPRPDPGRGDEGDPCR